MLYHDKKKKKREIVLSAKVILYWNVCDIYIFTYIYTQQMK